MALELGKTYYLKNVAVNKYLNVYGNETISLGRNVNLYTKEDCNAQKWLIDRKNSNDFGVYVMSKLNTGYTLNIYEEDSNNCTVYPYYYNGVYNVADAMVDFLTVDASQDLYRIKLVNHNKYLSLHYLSDMNVYWSSNINDYTLWQLEEVASGTNTPTTPVGREEKIVTDMPSGAGYDSQELKETFHPDAGMSAGTWAANNGATIESRIANFYTTVYGVAPASKLKYLYSLYGGKYISGKYIGQYHPGVDINYYHGATIYPSRSGTVVDKGTFHVTVQSGNEYLIYVHLNPSSSIGVNSAVIAGETPLGTQSCLGLGLSAEEIANGKDSHLHIEVHKVSTGNTAPQKPTKTVNDYMTITIPPYEYLN